ncbi:MAG: polysaccharide biosynthesis protein [Firmicutes bacterium]|nr:polysaccharide biosynthesis protein [Bacillota bacterium]
MEERSQQQKRTGTFVGGAIILGFAGLLVKLLGALFRIPLGNIIGDDGMGYYQTAYPIYNLFLTIATAGIPTAIARMTSERYAIDRPYEAYRVFRISSVLLFATGALSCGIFFFGAGAISNAVKEPDAIYCMRSIAIALLFVPLMGSFRGFFQGRQNMRPTAVSQVVEQIFRVAVGLSLTVLLLDKGLPIAAAGASFGAAAGGIFGFICILLIYRKEKKKIDAELVCVDRTPKESTKDILKTIIGIAVPITIGASVMPIINALDTAIVKSRLIAIGYDSNVARALYGQLTGMAAPIINLPQVFTQAVSMSLVPVVAASFRRGDREFMNRNISLSLRYAMIVSAPCAAGIIVLAKPIMKLLYPYQRESAVSAAGCLAVLAVGTVFLALVHASTGTLQGIGKQQIPVLNLGFGALAKVGVTYVLTAVPFLNVKGAACGTVAAYLVAALLNILRVKHYTGVKIEGTATFLKPVFCAAVMGGFAYGVYALLEPRTGNAVATLLAVFAGVLVYALMIFMTRTLSAEELESLPKGKRLSMILKKLRILR